MVQLSLACCLQQIREGRESHDSTAGRTGAAWDGDRGGAGGGHSLPRGVGTMMGTENTLGKCLVRNDIARTWVELALVF